jgi:hypothetical protein
MFKTFYLTRVYLSYIPGYNSSTQIVTYSQSQSFTGSPKQEFNHENWNAKATAIHDMGDKSTPIGSFQEGGGDAQRAPGDGDDAQRASPSDGAPADGGPEHLEEVLPNIMLEEDVNAKTETAASDVGEGVGEAERNAGADQQVVGEDIFFISVISYFFYLIHFLHCPSIRFLLAVLVTLLMFWGR